MRAEAKNCCLNNQKENFGQHSKCEVKLTVEYSLWFPLMWVLESRYGHFEGDALQLNLKNLLICQMLFYESLKCFYFYSG